MSERYARQIALPEIGEGGQARLRAASVLVIGAGGLGCAVLPYLCAAGVGRLVILDPDEVEESNLPRQPLYRMADLGLPKAQAARSALRALNPDVRIEAFSERLTPGNAARWVEAAEVIVDAADSFAVTYVLSDACRLAGRALVSASALGLAGYAGAFCGGAPSYRAVFPDLPQRAASCAQAGVLGSVVGVLGTLQAHLTLALLLDLRPCALGRLLSVDLRTLHVASLSFAGAAEPQEPIIPFIAAEHVTETDLVVDLRSLVEAPVSPFAGALRLGVEELEGTAAADAARRGGGDALPGAAASAGTVAPHWPRERRIVLCCRTGLRAWRAARALQRQGHEQLALIALGE